MCIGNGEKRIYKDNQINSHKRALRRLRKKTGAYPARYKQTRFFCVPLIISLVFSCTLQAQFLDADQPAGGIRINQIGYGLHDPKIAILDSELFPGQGQLPFYIIALNQFADTVFRGQMKATGKDLYAQNVHYLADFSRFSREGHYYLSIPGQGTSYPFYIQADPFNTVLKAAVKAYYYNRASTALAPENAGIWKRAEGHPDTKVWVHASARSGGRPEGTVISAPGGWYDAGDYNKYIVNAAITVNTLLEALDQYPAVFDKLNTHIPESGNRLPDLLDELLYNLRWMLKMQDPGDGGVYHKLTSARFDGMEMPDKDKDRRYVVQKSTAAALDFAAVMATAARVLPRYGEQLPGFMDSLGQAAVRAWDWAKANPGILYNQDAMNKKYRPKIMTGAYGDKDLSDEWYQAAASLLLTTKDRRFLPVLQQYPLAHISAPSWNSVAAIGAVWLSRLNPAPFQGRQGWSVADKEILLAVQQKARTAVLQLAGQLTGQTNPGLNTVMGGRKTDFNWGSNSQAANQGWILMEAYLMTKDKKYRAAALGNLDYLLGRNATGYCFITGFGSLSPMHPHHRISIADNITDPVPGFLVGGPNPGRQDGVKGYPSERADLSYIDNDKAYSVNEVAINWNAPLVYLLAAIAATR